MARFIHETGMRERRNMRDAARHRAEQARESNWAVVNWRTNDVIQDDFDSEEAAHEWLEQLPSRGPNCPEFAKNGDEVRVVDIG